jgi:phenylacetate-CoA ligase
VSEELGPFMFDREVETMPRRNLAALQLRRLRKSLAYAYQKVPHITRKFGAAGVTPEKADLRDTYPFGLFAVPREQVLRLHASSGTTGKPTVVGYTRADLDLWSDLMARTLACAGARPGDMVHNAYGYGLFTGGLGFQTSTAGDLETV